MGSKRIEIRLKVAMQLKHARFGVETLKTKGFTTASLNWGFARIASALSGQLLSHQQAITYLGRLFEANHGS